MILVKGVVSSRTEKVFFIECRRNKLNGLNFTKNWNFFNFKSCFFKEDRQNQTITILQIQLQIMHSITTEKNVLSPWKLNQLWGKLCRCMTAFGKRQRDAIYPQSRRYFLTKFPMNKRGRWYNGGNWSDQFYPRHRKWWWDQFIFIEKVFIKRQRPLI